MLTRMFLAGAKNLEAKKEWINELNVFPVPDGDTGTNMTMTIMSAAKEVSSLEAMGDITMQTLCKAISSGSLRGARGNSGVILSQLFRGFTKVAAAEETLDVAKLAVAVEKAVETAYKAVMKPKEGTILTVAKYGALKARELADAGETDITVFIDEVIKASDDALEKTPEMLPVLKQAGVVDSGGQGLMQVLKGAFDAFQGKELDLSISPSTPTASAPAMNYEAQANADIKFGYCTEFIILLNKNFNIKTELDFKAYLESIGDSIVVVADDEIVKVHVHTNDPGLAIQKALLYGALSNMKIDNMRMEHQEKLFKMNGDKPQEIETKISGNATVQTASHTPEPEVPAEKKEAGFISVSVGDGIKEIFEQLGVDYIIEGGQPLIPITADMLDAIDKVNAETIYILPNNKNIILAANQAQSLVEDKKIVVIPTKTVPQGITAVINYVPDLSVEENTAAMTEEISRVKTGQVTYAVRDTTIDDKVIKQGDYMGIGDKGILSVGRDLDTITRAMVDAMMDDEAELVSIYYGAEIDEKDAEKLTAELSEKYPDCDVELQYGGQPIYYYIISVE